ncbi:hypothetical protein [Thermococcus sp. AM4]|uniref:hypothetical protein n=1 Tax=Thermococcus sp. (strain AM4) TaxID=246969 RepID=UPI000186FA3C|nr:hypothetical protein [Thermococcus sp. AM4]EEB74923.1 hypothetical protein TAM4_868 [Thermococcus sp. AM4]
MRVSGLRAVLAILIILLAGLPPVIAADFRSVEIKVYNVNTNHVYFDKIIPKDQPYHVVLNVEGDTYDITYDPSKSGGSTHYSCVDSSCTITIVAGVKEGHPTSSQNGPIKVIFIPSNKSPGGSTKAPIPAGVYWAVLGILIVAIYRRG